MAKYISGNHFKGNVVSVDLKILVTWHFMTHSRVTTIQLRSTEVDDSPPVTHSQLPTLLANSFIKFYMKYFIETNLRLRKLLPRRRQKRVPLK